MRSLARWLKWPSLERLQRDRRIDQAVAQIAQSLPERGAAAGAIFDAGKGLGAGLARADDLAQRFFEKEIAMQFQRRAAAFGIQPQRQLVKGQHLHVEQRQTAARGSRVFSNAGGGDRRAPGSTAGRAGRCLYVWQLRRPGHFRDRDEMDRGSFAWICSTAETHTGQNQYEIAVGDWQGMICVHHSESEIGRKVRKELIGSYGGLCAPFQQMIANAQAKH